MLWSGREPPFDDNVHMRPNIVFEETPFTWAFAKSGMLVWSSLKRLVNATTSEDFFITITYKLPK